MTTPQLINFQNERSRFMFNFGAGAMLLKHDTGENIILGSSAITDGSLSEAVILTETAIGDALHSWANCTGDWT